MKLKVFSVYDAKTEAYMKPFFEIATGSAVRGYTEACNTPDHMFSKYPGDFVLFEVAEYDDATGLFSPLSVFNNLGLALDYIEKKPTAQVVRPADLHDRGNA